MDSWHNFQVENLREIYKNKVSISQATGIDNMNHEIFWSSLNAQLAIINEKILLGNYKLSKYKLKLISKGRGKEPREISIPTIRDRIALRALCDFLQNTFEYAISFDLPQNIIKQIKSDINTNQYNRHYFII